MPKSKKSRKSKRSQDEQQSDSSENESCNSVTETRHHKQKSSKHSNKKNRSTKDSDSDDSSSTSSSSTSASELSDAATRKTSKQHAKRHEKSSKQRVRNDEEQGERKQRRRTHSREREEISSGGEPHVSKWDSPERRNRQLSRSRSRQRQRQSMERERSEQRDALRSHGERNDRGNRSRNEYGGRDRLPDRRDYRDRYVNRNREERWRDERGHPNERFNERRGRSRSPRTDKSQNRSQGNERFKREPREHSRQRNSPVRRGRTNRRNSREDDSKNYEWGGKRGDDKHDDTQTKEEPVEKEKPNFGLSGALLEDTNKVNGVVVKYAEPPEARKPKRRWRLYPFKGETALPTLHIHRQSCFLVGRDRKVADLAVDHPSCSKQHAALQYRLVPFERDDGSQGKRVRLYLIDLESANGTFLNNKKIEPRKYYELIEKDVVKFGFSTREYVLLHENSKEDQEDDDVIVKPEPEDVPDGPNP
ncbi:smad nuclear interacting protein 1 [Zeugodacus cucurbitae]|uniref:smad nuclear interacting protein 1 n=1 Tax=Zeugodacus cucurbitae TaxID=28588 RepID=UPI000596908A|nr:smad nuclear interacting protein 1 [Zeugodacus cucurbitae]